MIKVIAKLVLKQGKFEEMKAIVTELVAKTVQEEGNIAYQFFQDTQNPDLVFFVEEWKSKEALKAHTMTEHYQKASKAFSDLVQEKEIHICTLVM